MISKETTNGSLHPEDSLVSCGLCVGRGGGDGGRDEIEIFTTDPVAVTDNVAYYCV